MQNLPFPLTFLRVLVRVLVRRPQSQKRVQSQLAGPRWALTENLTSGRYAMHPKGEWEGRAAAAAGWVAV